MAESLQPPSEDIDVPDEIISTLESQGILDATLGAAERKRVLRAVALSISISEEHHHGDGLPALIEVVAQHNIGLADQIVEETLSDVRSDRQARERDQDEECKDRAMARHTSAMAMYFTWGFALFGTMLSFAGFAYSHDPFWLLGTLLVIGGPVMVTILARNTTITLGKTDL